METTTYGNINDVIDLYVAPALGEYEDDYDMLAIAQEITAWNGSGLVITEDGEENFFEIADRHINDFAVTVETVDVEQPDILCRKTFPTIEDAKEHFAECVREVEDGEYGYGECVAELAVWLWKLDEDGTHTSIDAVYGKDIISEQE